MEHVRITSTSLSSAMTDDLVLRETGVTRLVFRPVVIENQRNPEAAVRGTFVFQHKRRNDAWTDVKDLSLSDLKGNEWVKLDLKGVELLTLFKKLRTLYQLYAARGIPRGEHEFIAADSGLGALLAESEDELETVLGKDPENALRVLRRLLTWMAGLEEPGQAFTQLEGLTPATLQNLGSLVGVTTLQSVLSVWGENDQNADEDFWQRTLSEHCIVLSQMFSRPVVILQEKAYVGGKSIANVEGNVVDFLVRNRVGGNVALVELKTPETRLLGGEYRDGVYAPSKEITGPIVQIATYKQSLLSEYHRLVRPQRPFEAFDPECIVVAGHYERQLLSAERRRSFELFRRQARGIQVITYDELFGKVRLFCRLLKGLRSED